MASVTQLVPDFLGGVSKLPDDRKSPGQVREAINAYPDSTFGLTKRPGLKFLKALDQTNQGTVFSGTALDNAKWFYIHRDGDETYIGCIVGHGTAASANIHVWNAKADGNGHYIKSTITASNTNKAYLNSTDKNDYQVLTVQDTTIITNRTKVITPKAATSFTAQTKATVQLKGVDNSAVYSFKIQVGDNAVKTISMTSDSSATADEILTDLKDAIDTLANASTAGFEAFKSGSSTVYKLSSSLEIESTAAFTITEVSGGINGNYLEVFQDKVGTVANLPAQSKHDRVVEIVNTSADEDQYYSKFVAENGVSGPGYWEETLKPGIASGPGLTASTMPHELVNTGLNTFTFQPITWTDRLVGDDVTNSQPSFIKKNSSNAYVGKIEQTFFSNNRLGFLTGDNVVMSQAGEFYNFYSITAQTATDADPIDISCSSVSHALLHGVLPVTQGLMLFSEKEQFLMYSADGNLKPSTALIRSVSNFEMDTDIDPVSIGPINYFVSKTPANTRVFGIAPQREGQTPEVIDIGKTVSEYIPNTMESLLASSQNAFVLLYGSSTNTIYLYRILPSGQAQITSWFNWKLPGKVLHVEVDSDVVYIVIKDDSDASSGNHRYHLLTSNLSATPEDEALISSTGVRINPYMDMYAKASSIVADYVESITLTEAGSNYSSAPTVTITNTNTDTNPGSNATATATVANGAVTGFTITNGGTNYSSGATVSFSGGGGSGAKALAVIANKSKCYLPYDDIATLNPLVMKTGDVSSNFSAITESGLTYATTRGTDSTGDYFLITNENLISDLSRMIVGYEYEYDIHLPKTFFRQNGAVPDYTANLTISRMKFSVERSSAIGFKVLSKGIRGEKQILTGNNSTTAFEIFIDYVDKNDVKVLVNGTEEKGFTLSDPTATTKTLTFTTAPALNANIEVFIDPWYEIIPSQLANTYLANDVPLNEQHVFSVPIHQRTDAFSMRVFSTAPFPVSLTSLMWEGNYSPRFYRRT